MTGALGSRQAVVLAHLEEHPGLTAGELSRVFGLSGTLHRLLGRLESKARVVAVTAWEPHQGRQVARWHVAPPGTIPPPPRPPGDPEIIRRHRERDRLSQRARRARARGLAVVPDIERPSRRDADLSAAACRTADPGLFFGTDHERPAARQVREAKAAAICATCPVRDACYAGAVQRGERWGIWAGINFESESKKGRKAS